MLQLQQLPRCRVQVPGLLRQMFVTDFFKTTDEQMMGKIKEKESEERQNASMNIRNVIWKHQMHIVL